MAEDERTKLADATVLVEAPADLAVGFVKVCPCCQREFPADVQINNCPDDGNLLAPVSASLIGSTIDGRYHIEKLLAVGAWSEVYLASQSALEKKIAIKILHLNLVSEPARVIRFEDEARAASRLKNPSIVSVHDFGLTADARPFIVMDYIEGSSLADTLKIMHLTPETAARYCIQLACALQEAHKQGIIHRDVKPANIIVACEYGNELCHLLDFGVAKTVIGEERADVTRTGEVLGTPAYMSPEQCRAQPIDARSDIYSLGCVFYEMLTGERLVKGSNSFACMKWHMSEMPPEIFGNSPVMPALSAIVLKMLEKNPDDRYQTMEALIADIENALRGAMITAPPRRRNRYAALIASALLLFILLLLFQKNSVPQPTAVHPTGPISVYSNPVNRVEKLSEAGYAQKQLQQRFARMQETIGWRITNGKTSDAKYLESRLRYYQDLYSRKLPLPDNELAQEMVVSILEAGGPQIPEALSHANVDVSCTNGPVVLFLNSHYPMHWSINVKQGVQLERVVLTGEQKCFLENPPKGVEFIDQSGKDNVALSPLAIGMANPQYIKGSTASPTRFGMNFTTLNAYHNALGLNINVGPGNDSWLAQYVMSLMAKDMEAANIAF